MHRLAAIPGAPSDQGVELVEQSSAPLLFLTSADSDLALLAQQKRQPHWRQLELRGLNLAALQHPAAVDHYLRSTASAAKLILVRLLGGGAIGAMALNSCSIGPAPCPVANYWWFQAPKTAQRS